MPMGRSGGRSAKNKSHTERRATPRERQYVDPPGHDEWEHVRIKGEPWFLTTRGRRVREVIIFIAVATVWAIGCGMAAAVLCAWFGVI